MPNCKEPWNSLGKIDCRICASSAGITDASVIDTLCGFSIPGVRQYAAGGLEYLKNMLPEQDTTVPGCLDCLSTESPINCLWNCKWIIAGIAGAILMLEIINAKRM